MNSSSQHLSLTVFAPATVANVAVGFDLLGFPVEDVGDKVTLHFEPNASRENATVEILSVDGIENQLPMTPEKNTAGMALLSLIKKHRLKGHFKIAIEKGIPISSGMGGSAASAVGAVVAANALSNLNLSPEELIEHALDGESIASGARHADNVAPCLLGGLVLALSTKPVRVQKIAPPSDLRCVLVHPHHRIDTRDARSVLSDTISFKDHVKQSAHLAGFLLGCWQNDIELIQENLKDLIVEKQRASLIPGFKHAQKAALQKGALGFSISGAGPAVFALCQNDDIAQRVHKGLLASFEEAGLGSNGWISPISIKGATVVHSLS